MNKPLLVKCSLLAILQISILSAQLSSNYNENLLFESYIISEQVNFYLPDEAIVDNLTEWDWIEMEPHSEVRQHMSYVNQDFQRFEQISFLETDQLNSWDHKIDKMIIDSERTIMYDINGEEILNDPHSQFYLESEITSRQLLQENGFDPLKPFLYYDQLPIDEINLDGFQAQERENGYLIWNDQLEIFINPIENIRVIRALHQEFDIPFHTYEKYNVSPQGCLYPVFRKVSARLKSQNGECIIKVVTESFSDYELYYDPIYLPQDPTLVTTLEYDFSIAPNPVIDYMEISYSGKDLISQNYDLHVTGQLNEPLLEINNLNTANTEQVNLSHLSRGVYFIRFTVGDQSFTKKIFKN